MCNGQKVARFVQHLMHYAPYLTNKHIGSTDADANAPWMLNEGLPHADIITATRVR